MLYGVVCLLWGTVRRRGGRGGGGILGGDARDVTVDMVGNAVQTYECVITGKHPSEI